MSNFIDENLKIIRPLLGIGIIVSFVLTVGKTRFGKRFNPSRPAPLSSKLVSKKAKLYGRFQYHSDDSKVYFKHEPLKFRLLFGRSAGTLCEDPEAFKVSIQPRKLDVSTLDGKWGYFQIHHIDSNSAAGSAFIRYRWYHLFHAKV